MPSAADRKLADVAGFPGGAALPLAAETTRAAAESQGKHDPEAGRGRPLRPAASLRRSAERIASRLCEGDASGARGEVESAIRERPLGTVLVGVAVGFCLGRVLRR